MALPLINFKATNTDLEEHLQDLAEAKLATLDKYIGNETDVQCEVEFSKESNQHNGKIYRVEVNLWLKGVMYRATATEDLFEKSIDKVRNELDQELRRAGKKKENLYRKGKRAIKNMLRME